MAAAQGVRPDDGDGDGNLDGGGGGGGGSRAARPAVLARLDRVLHEPVRLAIVSVLAPRRDIAFTELRDLVELTDGNLSVHLRTLEEAGYVTVEKGFVGRKPRTTLRLARKGRAALDKYLDALEALLKAARRNDG